MPFVRSALKSALASAVLCAGLAGCAATPAGEKPTVGTTPETTAAMAAAKLDIVETAVGPGMTEVITLVRAISAADLVEPLKGKGPFTVFAPTNAAFASLPPGTLDDLLKPENKAKLRAVLLYHVHGGDAVMAKDVKPMTLTTLNGRSLAVKVDAAGVVTVNDAKVVKTDVVATNGVIHWVDAVILPPM